MNRENAMLVGSLHLRETVESERIVLVIENLDIVDHHKTQLCHLGPTGTTGAWLNSTSQNLESDFKAVQKVTGGANVS